ncbi:MAG: GtrA family protein [Methylocystaceae bacterium]
MLFNKGNSSVASLGHYIRYIFVGFLTTLINFLIFWSFHYLIGFEINSANTLSVIGAVLFAYFANKTLVFMTPFCSIRIFVKEILSFFLSRLTTMAIEVVGVNLIYIYVYSNAAVSKIAVIVIVLLLNYLLSQYFVFTKR